MRFCNENVLNVYLHGSRVYGTASADSDTDYIVVVKENPIQEDSFTDNHSDYVIFTKEQWSQMAQNGNTEVLECLFLPDECKIKETYVPPYTRDIQKIRAAFSEKASNSWVKCKKKLTVEKDFASYIGKKSLWHSLRLLQFGIQILEYGQIIQYGSANPWFDEIVQNEENDWSHYKEKYQPLYNALKSQFRLSAKKAENRTRLFQNDNASFQKEECICQH